MTVRAERAVLDRIPFMSLGRHHRPLAAELRRAFDEVLEDGGFVLGAEVERFEEEFADYCEVGYCVGVNSGTAALTLALRAAGVGLGDEVIVPAHTFIASGLAVVHAGATPILCDVDEETGLIDPDAAAAAVGPGTAAIVAVQLYGQVCPMDRLAELCDRHGLLLLEDAAQAHGARWDGRRVGSLGDVAAFSFYPSKNLGALGDGGAICTDDAGIAAAAKRLRNLGQESKGVHVEVGMNERLDGMQAAALRVKLPHLDRWNSSRRALAGTYREALAGVCPTLKPDPRSECVYHLFPVRVPNRDAVRAELDARGVDSGVHYWPALHRQPPFNGVIPEEAAVSAATRWSEEELSLPIFPELRHQEAQVAAAALRDSIEATL
jgi:dTDP-3-amino-3,4,6-trideoxy-alpha-D-glucose transaminase